MKLTDNEKRALARWYLGGVEALRTPAYSAATSTVSALVRKGLADKHGMTQQGREIGKELADSGIV